MSMKLGDECVEMEGELITGEEIIEPGEEHQLVEEEVICEHSEDINVLEAEDTGPYVLHDHIDLKGAAEVNYSGITQVDPPPMVSEEVVCCTSSEVVMDMDSYEEHVNEPVQLNAGVVYVDNNNAYAQHNVTRRVPTVSSVKMTSTGRIIKVIRGAAPRQDLGGELPEEIAQVIRQKNRGANVPFIVADAPETLTQVRNVARKYVVPPNRAVFPVAAPSNRPVTARRKRNAQGNLQTHNGIADQLKRLLDNANEEDPPTSDEELLDEEHLPLRCLPVAEQFRIARMKRKPKRKRRMVRMPKYVNEQTSRWASPAYERVSKLVASTRDEDKPLACPDCPSRFKSKNAMRAHRKENHGPPEALPYPCKMCAKRFLWASKLRIHEALIHKIDHGAASFRCEDCGKLCGSKIYLERHRVSHTSVRTFRCELCGSSFKSKWNLQLHLRYGACPASLRRQEEDYGNSGHAGGQGECECIVCGRLYASKGALYVHQSHSHQVSNDSVVAWEVYSCPKCGAVYENQAALERHKRSHGKDRPWACKVCDRRFKTKESLEWHMQRFMHHDVSEETTTNETTRNETEVEQTEEHNLDITFDQQQILAIKAEAQELAEELDETNSQESIEDKSSFAPSRRSARTPKPSKKFVH